MNNIYISLKIKKRSYLLSNNADPQHYSPWSVDADKTLSCKYRQYTDIYKLPDEITELYLTDDNDNNTSLLLVENKLLKLCISYGNFTDISGFMKYITVCSLGNNKLTTLPDEYSLPNLIYLNCSGNKLSVIPDYPKLQYLNASYNKHLILIGIYTELTYLNINYTNVMTVCDYPALTELHARCSSLKIIINVPKLQKADVLDTNITDLSCFTSSLTRVACDQDVIIPWAKFPHLYEVRKLGSYLYGKKIKKLYNFFVYLIQLKYVNRWRLIIHKRKAKALILACQTQYFNPDYDFYKRCEEYIHFMQNK